MKHLFKKGLSLLLAVLMVTSMLPMSTLAAAITDSRTAGESGVYANREDADPPEDLTEAPADLADGEDDLRVELPADLEPVDDGEEDLRVELPADSEPADEEEDLRAETPAGEDQEGGDSSEKPDTGEEPDVPADLLWTIVTLDAVLVDADSGEIRVTGRLPEGNTSNAGLENAAIVLAPVFGSNTLRGMAGDGDISTATSASWLSMNLAAGLGVDASLIYIADVSTAKFSSGVWTYTAVLGSGMSYTDYIAKANNDAVTAEGGIPMQVMLISQGGDNPGICFADVTIQPTQAILEADPAKITLQPDWSSFTFTLQHTDASNMDANIIGITWEGNHDEYVKPPTITSLSLDDYDTAVTVTLLRRPNQLTDKHYTGYIVIEYNDTINTQPRFLTVEVTTGQVSPIYVTVTQGDTTSGGTETTHTTAIPGGMAGFLDPETDPAALSADWIGGTVPPSPATQQFWTEAGLTLDLVDGVFHNPDDYVTDWTAFKPDGKPDYENEDSEDAWFDDITGSLPTTLTKVTATADVPVGTYSGSISVVPTTADWTCGALVTIPVFITVVPASEYSAIFYANGGTWSEEPLNIRTLSTTDAAKRGGAVTPPPDPTREGYTFLGWGATNDATTAVASTTYSNSATAPNRYYAIWQQDATTFTLTYDGNAGTDTVGNLPAKVTQSSTDDPYVFDLTFTPVPTRSGYVFAGWSDSAGASNSADYTADGVTQVQVPQSAPDKTVYAVWTAVYEVKYVDATDTADHTYPKFTTALPSDTNKYKQAAAVTVKYVSGTGVGDEKANGTGLVYQFTGWTRGDTSALITGNSLNMPASNVTLTATWSPVMVTVTYDLQGGIQGTPATTSDDVPKTVQKGGTYTILAGNPTKAGYTFEGWSTGTTGGQSTAVTKLKKDGTVSNVTANLTLTAVWTADANLVQYLWNYTGAPNSGVYATENVNTGDSPAGVNDPTRTGYTFGGWYSDAGCADANKIADVTKEVITAATDYYAKWTENDAMVTFHTQSGTWDAGFTGDTSVAGTGNDYEVDGKYHDTLTVPGTDDIARTGYTFQGWATSSGSTTTVTVNTKLGEAEAVSEDYYAVWKINQYDLIYDKNGKGADASVPATSKKDYNSTVTLAGAMPTWTDSDNVHWVSSGWSESKTGTVVSSVTMPAADKTVYAIWAKDKHTLTYNANGGTASSVPSAVSDIECGTDQAVDVTNAPTWDANHRFLGWDTDKNATTPTYPKGTAANITVKSNVTLYAIWEAVVTVTWKTGGGTWSDAQGGGSADKTQTGKTGETMTTYVGGTDVTRANYRFQDWTNDPSSGKLPSSDTTYTARWVGQSSVEFVVTDGTWVGTGGGQNQTGDVSTNIAMPAAPTREGYDFAGWKKGTDAAVTSGIKFPATPGATDTYVAQWTVKQYTVAFLWNTTAGGHTLTQEYTTTKGNYGAAITTPTNDPTMTGYTFGGWYKDADCTTAQALSASDTYPAHNNMKVYAKWTAKTHTVTYAPGLAGTNVSATIDLDDSTAGAQTTDTFTYDATSLTAKTADVVKWTSDAVKAGWNFTGWKSNAADGTKDYAASASLGTNAKDYDFTLTAQWTIDISYDANLPETDPAGESSLTVPTTPAKIAPGGRLSTTQAGTPGNLTNWNFAGWNTKADGTGDTVTGGTSGTVFDKPTTIYAQWTPVKYTVSFVDNSGDSNNPPAEANKNYNSDITLPASSGDKMGYTFAGWYKETELTNKAGDVGDSYTVTGNATLYGKWNAADVTIVYQTDVGTAPGSDTKKYDATDYAAKNKNTITATSGGWNAGETIFTDASGDRWQFNGWDILKADNSVLKQVASGAAINPVNTTNGVVKQADGTYTLTLKANWTPLYSVIYKPGDHGAEGTQPAAQQNKPAGSFAAASPADVIVKKAMGDTWANNRYDEATGGHWYFEGWKVGDTNTVIASGAPVTTTNGDVVLTAQWKKQIKVTLGKPVGTGLVTTGSTNDNYVTADLNTVSKNSGTTSNFSWVDDVPGTDPAMTVAALTLAGPNSGNYLFEKWTVDPAANGAFNTAGGTAMADTFKPTDDVTIVSNWLLKPTLTTNHGTHHLNDEVDAIIAADHKWPSTKNELPKYTWTANDATIGTIVLTKPDGSTVTLTDKNQVDIDSTTTSGQTVITFKRAYLTTLDAGEYTLTVNATTGSTATPTTAKMEIAVTPEKLLQLDIGVKKDTAASYEDPKQNATPAADRTKSANVDGAAQQLDGVKYLDHRDTRIIPGNLVTYEWYYGPTAPNQTKLASNASVLKRSDIVLPSGAMKIKDGDTTGAVDVNDLKYKGQYIFAVAVATGTGTGAVVTNSIPVDYDAVIKVKKDNADITATVKDNYKVYLVPSTVSNPSFASGSMTAGIVEAKYLSGNQYKTDDSALTGGVTYKVYVNKVEGDTTVFADTNLTVKTQTAADAAPVVNFYSVNAVDTDLKHAKDSNNVNVGESFGASNADVPATEFYAEGVTAKFNSGMGVLTGSKVTAKASKTWTQDYDVNWGMKEDTATTAPTLTYGTENQTAANAAGTGKDYANIKAKTWIGAQLEQNTYEIKGDIKGDGGKVATATLTYKNGNTTYTFNGNVGNGAPGATVTFTVPKSDMAAGGAITGKYTITATGATNPQTTVMGYSVPSKAAPPDQQTPMDLQQVTAAGTDKFTIFIAASKWALKVEDDHKKDGLLSGAADIASVEREHTTEITNAANVLKGDDTTTWTKIFANYNATTDQLVYHVTVSNPGNTDLTVSLAVKRDGTTIYDASTALTGNKDSNGVEFPDLASSFDLARMTGTTPNSKTFTVTIPTDLDNDDDVTYSFEFSSKDKNTTTIYGPTLTYNLKLVVNPIPVETVSIGQVSGKTYSYTVDAATGVTFQAGLTTTELNKTGAAVSGKNTDVAYSWYAIPHGATASINDTTGVITVSSGSAVAVTTASLLSDGNRTIDLTGNYDYAGKDLVAVAHGVENATDYAISGSFPAPRQLVIDLYHNSTKQTGTTAPAGHTVYVVPKDSAFDMATAIQATWDGTKDGYTAAVTTGEDYDIYANIVGGTATANKDFQKITTVASTATANPQVIYHSVTINDTTVDNTYTGLVGTDYFTAAPTQKPTATVPDKAATPGTIAVTSGDWVVKGNNVTFTYPAWNKDYSLAWSGSVSATDANTTSANNAVHTLSNLAAAATVDTELQLKLYKVTAYVVGAGTANYITMTSDTDANRNTFTSKTDTPSGSILGIASSRGSINATESGAPVEFSVPKGTYVALGDATGVSGTTREGYHNTHNDSTLVVADTITKTITAEDTFDVVLTSTGVGLSVTDDDTGDNPHSVSGMYEDTPVAATTEPAHTEPLDYGYTGTRDIVLTLKNVSAEAAGHKQLVYNIAGKGGDATGSPTSGVTWTSTDLSSDGTTDTIDVLDEDGAPTVTLTIPNGLKAETYTYNAVFTFAAEDGGATVGTLTYVLKIVVKPAEFATVTMKYDGAAAAIDTTKVLEAGKDLALHNATTTVNNVFSSLTFTDDAKDYHYAWYASTDNSIKTADLNWNDTTGAVTFTGGKSATAIGTVDQNLSAATIAANQSKYIYLMIYATADNGKVVKAAISDPVRAGYQGVVQIKEDGALQTAEPKTDDTAKYTVFIMDGTDAIPTAWDATAQGYVAVDNSGDPIYLDPTKTYTVKTSAYEGDTTTIALNGASIKGDNLTGNPPSHIATAEYFTVTAVATTAVHYVDDVGETFDNDNMPKAGLTIGTADVDGKTVLKGQSVAAKFAETAAGSGVAWTQDYKLTWQKDAKTDNTSDGTALADVSGVTDTAASALTGQTWSNITAKTYIGGRLDQNVYTISGTIEGSGSVASVVMTDGKNKANTTVQGGTINKNNDNKITNVNNDTLVGNQGDTITLKVVKGTYALKANAGANTTVVGITWASDGRVAGDNVTGKDVAADKSFIVHLTAATAKLQVADTHTTPTAHTATSDAGNDNDNYKHADHTHKVYFSAMTADEELTVTLQNKGNTDLTLDTPTIWKVNAGKTLADLNNYWGNWANTANPVTPMGSDGAYSETDVIDIVNLLEDGKTLTGATTNDAGVQLDNGETVNAATITIDQNVDVADSGIYILRYTTGNGGPVVYYVLNLVVDPLPITGVDTDPLAEAPGAGDKVQLQGYTGGDGDTSFQHVWVDDDGNTTTAAVAASAVTAPALTDGTDVKYQWVKTSTSMTAAAVKALLKVDANGVGVASGTAVTVLSGNGANTKQYTVQGTDADSFLYLVAYAPKGDTVVNTTDFAVSGAIKTKETVKIQVTLNRNVQNPADKNDPQYAIKLLADGTDAEVESNYIATSWNPDAVAADPDTKYYTAAIDTTKVYHIYAETYKGSGALVDTGLTLGKTAGDPDLTAVVPYFTVNYTENLAVNNGNANGFKSYLPGGNATSANAIQKALSVAVSTTKGGSTYGAPLTASGTPVLSGMHVKVTVDATKENNNNTSGVKKSWSEDAVQPLHTLTANNEWTPSTTSYADSITSGDILVNSAKTFSASLAPVTFTVQFTVVDITDPKDGNVNINSATLTRDTTKEPGATGFTPITGTRTNDGKDGATVTFSNVPAGDLEITAVGNTLTQTMVVGYTWNDADAEPVDPGTIVTVTTDTTKNVNTGNTIQIQRATNLVLWMDNFNTEDASILDDFTNSRGFQRVDKTGGADLSLPQGYNAGTHTLTYMARVKNVGTTQLEGFRITPSEVSGTILTFDLDAAKIYDAEGKEKTGAGSVASMNGILLAQNEYVEFPVTIMVGKSAQRALYNTTTFTASCTNDEGLPANSSTYTPAYQVKSVIETAAGSAEMFYGAKDFDTETPATVTQISVTGNFAGQDLAYALLSEEELTEYLDGADRPANAYTTDGFEDSGVTSHAIPAWLTINAGTGEISVDDTKSDVGKGVHVQKTADGADVTNELIVYVKVTSADDARLEKIVPFTVNMKTSPLKIMTDNVASEDQKVLDGDAYRTLYNEDTDATYPGQGVDIAHGEKVLLEYFKYIQVESQKNSADVVDNNGHAAYAAGANRWDSADGAANTGYGTVTKGHWGVAPASFDGTGSTQYDPNGGATNSHDYTFTYYYDGTGEVDKYDYADASIDLTIPVLVPALSLKFADTVKNYDDVKDVLNADEADYSAPGANGDNSPVETLDYSVDAWRKGETITYLDEEPIYTVKLQKLGVIYGLTLEEENVDGFKVVGGLPATPSDGDFDEKGDLTLEVEMTGMNSDPKLWAGVHTITLVASGYRSADMTGEKVTSTYELSVTVKPKTIPVAHVTELTDPYPDQQPDKTVKVTGEQPTDPTKEVELDKWKDKHDNHPIKPPVVTITPDETYQDGKEYKVTVELTADPNYTFEDETSEPEEPNYTAGDEGPDDNYDVTVMEDEDPTKLNVKVKFEKTTELPKRPALKFDDVKTGGQTRDPAKVDPTDRLTRQTFTVVKGEKLGTYTINLGAYGNTVEDVDVTETSKTLPTDAVWTLEPDHKDYIYDVESDTAGDKKVHYTLDLSGVDTTKLATGRDYTLRLQAKGTNSYGEDVIATYQITFQVALGAVGRLTFEDVNVADANDAVPASDEAERETITVKRGESLGQYTITLRNSRATTYRVEVVDETNDLPEGYTLTPVRPTEEEDMAAGSYKEFQLDLSGVETAKLDLGTYTLKLKAAGKDINGGDVSATYTVDIKVEPGTAGVLTFEDVNAADAKDAVPASTKAVRETITVKRGESLGKYTITLRDGVATTYQVGVKDESNTLPEGYTLTPVRPTAAEDMAVGSTKVFQLDLSKVDTAKLSLESPYTLVLEAKGKDINGNDVIATYKVDIKVEKAPAPELKFEDVNADRPTDAIAPTKDAVRNISQSTNAKLGKYIISLGSYGGTTSDIKFTEVLVSFANVGVYGVSPDCETLLPVTLDTDLNNKKQAFELDLSAMDTKTAGTYTLTITAKGVDINGEPVEATYTLTVTLRAPGGGGGGGSPSCPNQVTYLLGLYGTTNDPTMEMVSGSKVKTVPNVTAVAGYKFLGWSLAGPSGNIEQDAKRALVDPKNVTITTDTVFYAVYQPVYAVPQPPIHKHYVIGYPNGNFGPADNIDRASVATIIARAVLPNFVEGADYGNPGGYSDVNGHWAASAIAYCSKYGVFNGYTDGTFKPNQPISRQELALVMARLSGVRTGGSVPFTDISEAGEWALDGIYTAYINGWVNGYTDGTFKPVNPIRRDETVKIFNAYLHRGVNAEGLEGLSEYVHSGVASNNTEDGTSEYMTWPDVTKDQWAYYEIIEAANDHEFTVDSTQPKGYAVPEQWTKCWIDEKWRYHDDANDGGPSAVAETLPSESGLAD